PKPHQRPDWSAKPAEFQRALQLINSAERPIILAGHGVMLSGAMDILRACAEKASIRVSPTLRGTGGFPASHPLNLGMMGIQGDAIVVSDVGQHQMWEAQYYHHDKPRSLITSGGLGTMGFALPAAIGAKLACPDKEVWVVVGDGGFQMTMCELATIVQEQIDINVAIINNG